MNLPGFSVKRPVTVSMFFVGIVLTGIIAFRLLPVEMMPNTSFGDITINIDVRGGIPASEVERRIAKPVEEAVGTVSHLKNILSISKEGNATIILEFEPGINMDFAALEVREKFNRVKNKLPQEIEKPVIAKYEYMDVPIMIIAVTSEIRTSEQLRKIVDEKIKDRFQRIEGVARAEVTGGREGKVLIEIDPLKLQAYGLSINRIVDIVNLNNANVLAGEIKGPREKYLVRAIGEFENLGDLENMAVATTKQGSVVRLKDIAQIKDSYLDPVAFARLNTQPVVSIYVQKESNANTVKISSLIHKELKTLKQVLDKDVIVTATFNQAEAIQQAVSQVNASLLYGAILATLVLLIFIRDLRSVFIIASSIPLSVLLTFSLMFFSKLTINVMTLSGLALGVGMLVDNAIVVLDNTFKKRDDFLHHELANPVPRPETIEEDLAISGAEEMFLAITASTLTTLIVFLPLVFINQEIRMLYSGIALTITYSLLASLLAAVTLVPMLLAKIRLKPRLVPEAAAPETIQPAALETPAVTPLPDTATATPAVPPPGAPEPLTVKIVYKKMISATIAIRYLIVIFVTVCCLRVFQEAKKLEKEFIGIAEQNKFTVFVEMPTGTRIEVTDKVVAKVEKLIATLPEVKTATSKIEPWSSKVYVELQPLSKRKLSTAQLIEKLRPITDKLEPAFIYYEETEEMGTKEILIELYGYEYEKLKNLAIQVAQRLQSIPRFTDTKIRMREGRPEMHIAIDRRLAALSGFTVEDISLALHTHMRGLVATRYHGAEEPMVRMKEEPSVSGKQPPPFTYTEEEKTLEENLKELDKYIPSASSGEVRESEAIVRLDEKFRRKFDDMRRIAMVTPEGRSIFLSQLADFKFEYGPSEIWRKNKSRMVQVSSNTGGVALGTAAEKVKEVLKDLEFPKDYFWQLGGNYDKMIRNERELQFALLLSLILVYMVLASLFESLSEPLIILTTVPLAAIGAIIALRLTHKPIGIGVLIGAIMLGGIVVNNAIMLIDRVNFLKKKGASSSRAAVIDASFDRLRPIWMTKLTTILGLIPMALDKSESSNLWAPLAITVIGGLMLASFLTLFVIPCIYMIFRDLGLVRK